MALNIIEPSTRTVNTTLSHKLSAIQNQHQLDDGKKSTGIHRKRKNTHSPDHDANKRSKHTRKSNTRIEPNRRSEAAKKTKISTPPTSTAKPTHDDAHDDDDEQISLEEQELRLIALKSAVLKKHEARKRRQLATLVQASEQIARPYSPTDSIVLVTDEAGEPGESEERGNDGPIDSDSNNMDISPISSPTNQYQPMDMDLVSSNENSKSPIFSYEKPKTFSPFDSFIDWGNVHIPIPINAAAAAYVDVDPTACALNQPFSVQTTYSLIYDANIPKEPISVKSPAPAVQSGTKENEPNDSEADELRAKLIEQMRATNTMLPSNDANDTKCEATSGRKIEGSISNVDSLEEDCLRSLLLSSKGKKSSILKETSNEPHASKSSEITASKSCDDIPKLTLNLREALKRLKSKNLAATSNEKERPPISGGESNHLGKTHEDQHAIKHAKPLQNCDHIEIQETVVNKRVDVKVAEPPIEAKAELKSVTKVSDEIAKKTTSASASATISDPEKPSSTQTPLTEPKGGSENSSSSVACASKPPEKVVNDREPLKIITKQSVINPAALPKPKQKLTNESEPSVASATVSLRSKSSTPPTVSRAIASGTVAPTTCNKMESIRRSSGSPVISTWTVKPVKKLIISLNEDSSTDTDDTDCSTNKKTDNNTTEPASNMFQVRLDQFLQSVRANTTAATVQKDPLTNASTIKKAATTPPKAASKKDSPQKNQVMSTREPYQFVHYFKFQFISQAPSTSKAVAHLPISSQLEYHRLLNRMKLLEKQKEQKSRQKVEQQQPTVPTTVAKPVPAAVENFTVVVQNENRIIQMVDDSEKKPCDLTKVINKSSLTAASNASLARKVLVKNAIDSLSTSKVTTESMRRTDNTEKLEVKNEPAQTQAMPTGSGDKESGAKAKPTAMSLAMFAKKTPKVRATILANYVKKYRNQGFVSMPMYSNHSLDYYILLFFRISFA